ncbi:hypothetical protein DL762_008682 [Monosporascus cannonballus]|uniref:Myb-like domain-containing protein n=1 Tax=Monosporascus cannonballus TaxID=155416 RepID=A0ABY0GYR0_9PEZI|nr:hypothetical protein DL762_008682 [Monosporascus cannonballus]
MDDHTYMKSRTMQMHDGLVVKTSLPEVGHSHTTPSTSAYGSGDIQAYTSIPPFNNYSVHAYDSSSLPTPVSSAPSPPLSEGTSKPMQSYGQQGGGASQQPTPPGTSRPDWGNQQMHMRSSQSGSPMALQHTANDMLEMHGLEASHSPENHQPMVTEANWDWGHYGVSCTEAQADMSPQLSHHSLFPVSVPPSVAPSALVRPSMTLNHSNIPLAPAPSQVPLLQQPPDPRTLAHPMTSMGNMHHHFSQLPNQPPVLMEFKQIRRKPQKRPRPSSKRTRGPGRASNNNGYGDIENGQEEFGAGQHSRAQRAPVEQIKLSNKASEPDRYLFELRNRFLDSKGNGMWENLQAEYTQKYGPKQRAALQMQLSRAIMKYGQWPASEDEALRKAVEEVNKRRYHDIVKAMKEHGGCRAWDFNDGHVAKRVLELGLEEYDAEEPSKRVHRRTRKQATRRASAGGPWDTTITTNTTTTASSQEFGYEEGLRTLTDEQEEHLIHMFCKSETKTPEPDMMTDVASVPPSSHDDANRGAERDPGQVDSARVAKRACEQLFAKNVSAIYGKLPNENRHPMPL